MGISVWWSCFWVGKILKWIKLTILVALAAKHGHHKVVEILLQKEGIQINLTNRMGATPLLIATESSHNKIVELLLRQGAILVNQANRNGVTPLRNEASRGYDNIVDLLLRKDEIHWWISHQNSDLLFCSIRTLLSGGTTVKKIEDIEVNQANVEGASPLLMAVLSGHENIVKVLLMKVGLHVNQAANIGVTRSTVPCNS